MSVTNLNSICWMPMKNNDLTTPSGASDFNLARADHGTTQMDFLAKASPDMNINTTVVIFENSLSGDPFTASMETILMDTGTGCPSMIHAASKIAMLSFINMPYGMAVKFNCAY